MFYERIKYILCWYFMFTCAKALRFTASPTQDLVTTRVNTLSDDADDIQKQLDNEARDRIKFARPKTIWVFHFPSQITGMSTTENTLYSYRLPRSFKFKKSKKARAIKSEKKLMVEDKTPAHELQNEIRKSTSIMNKFRAKGILCYITSTEPIAVDAFEIEPEEFEIPSKSDTHVLPEYFSNDYSQTNENVGPKIPVPSNQETHEHTVNSNIELPEIASPKYTFTESLKNILSDSQKLLHNRKHFFDESPETNAEEHHITAVESKKQLAESNKNLVPESTKNTAHATKNAESGAKKNIKAETYKDIMAAIEKKNKNDNSKNTEVGGQNSEAATHNTEGATQNTEAANHNTEAANHNSEGANHNTEAANPNTEGANNNTEDANHNTEAAHQNTEAATQSSAVAEAADNAQEINRNNAPESTTSAEPEADKSSKTPETQTKDWNYKNQQSWKATYPACGGPFQSPVNLPFSGLTRTKGARRMLFGHYYSTPISMTMVHDGKTVSLIAEYPPSQRPFIYGGAAHSRRYIFHSLAFRWPAEHTIGGLYYPLESQAYHYSVEYGSLEDAIKAAARDKLAVLAVANIYKYANRNHKGLEDIVKAFSSTTFGTKKLKPLPLKVFSPPMKEYAAYQGSFTTPPCTENVLWLVRARALLITRELANCFEDNAMNNALGQLFSRAVQPLNDRNVYFFK